MCVCVRVWPGLCDTIAWPARLRYGDYLQDSSKPSGWLIATEREPIGEAMSCLGHQQYSTAESNSFEVHRLAANFSASLRGRIPTSVIARDIETSQRRQLVR